MNKFHKSNLKTFYICILQVFLLSGCVSYFTIENAKNDLPAEKDYSEIVWIEIPNGGVYNDKVHISPKEERLTLFNQDGDVFKIRPGEKTIVINYLVYSEPLRSAMPGFAIAEFQVVLEPGHRYYGMGTKDGNFMKLRIIDANTGEAVSSTKQVQIQW